MDTVDKETRSKIMSSVGQRNTGPEVILRSVLHKRGLRYRLHDRSLPGSPDLIFPRYSAVIFVHGCYWHSHGCYRSTVPKTRRNFWTEKFLANKERDQRNVRYLLETGWRVLTVWECSLTGKTALPIENAADCIVDWLNGRQQLAEISSNTG